MQYLKTISDAIDKHRAEAINCCSEDCWCWGVEAVICGHSEQPLNKVDAPNACECPQGSLCEFFNKDDESCWYGKI